MRKLGQICLIAAALALSAEAAGAQQTRQVRFAPGATSTTIKGTIRGRSDVTYLVTARAGQAMQVLFSPNNTACYFNVTEPGADTAVHIGSIAGNEFSKNLTVSGPYKVLVYLYRNAGRRGETCRYSLSFEITGGPATTAPASPAATTQPAGGPQAFLDACRSATAPMFGVNPRAVTVRGPVKPSPAGGYQIDGTVNKGPEGIKKMRCLFKSDGVLAEVRPLTPDGE